tara:strand:+ start:505 stop:858 length:354 start_codon:yes stop_codon:yes gene_type:complete
MEHNKKSLLEALELSLGIVSTACRSARVGRTTHYRWIKEDPEYAALVKEIEDVAVDFAESSLHQQIKKQIPSSTIFYLKTKGKKRGYIETQDITTGGQSFNKPSWFGEAIEKEDTDE